MKRGKYILTVTVNPALDQFLTIDGKFQPGGDFRSLQSETMAGGKGINVSRALKALGIEAVATGLIGGETGRSLLNLLREEEIAADFVPIRNKTRSNITIFDAHQRTTRILEPGPQILSSEWKELKKKIISHLHCAEFVIFSGSIPRESGKNVYYDLITTASDQGVLSALDTSGQALSLGIAARPSIVKPNLEEAGTFLDRKLRSYPEIKKAAALIQQKTGGTVFISLAENGAVGFDGKQCLHASTVPLKKGNPVGCGDYFLAGALSAWLKEKDLSQALKMGISCGAAHFIQKPAERFDLKRMQRILKQIRIRKI